MRFYSFFCPFLGELPCVFGRLPSIFDCFWGNIFYKCIYLSTFAIVKITLHIYRQDLRGGTN